MVKRYFPGECRECDSLEEAKRWICFNWDICSWNPENENFVEAKRREGRHLPVKRR